MRGDRFMENDRREMVNVVVVGHVDHGKSTVIGRLLADSGTLPIGKLEQVRETCRRNSKPFEYAFLLDALKSEQAQGITIDTARCFFSTNARNYIIHDAPGHVEFLKNMVTGASCAEAAFIVIDASLGVEENTRRHGYYLAMLGIKQIAVLINKMDLVCYSQERFENVKKDISDFLGKIDIFPLSYIPVSGVEGDNIAFLSPNMRWYKGQTVLAQMEAFNVQSLPKDLPLRLPVQDVYKFTENGDKRRIIVGSIETGTMKKGDEIIFYPSGKRAKVQSLEVFSGEKKQRASAGEAVGFTLSEQIFIKRGEIVCKRFEKKPCVGTLLRVNLFWLGEKAFDKRREYVFKYNTARSAMRLVQIHRIIDVTDLKCRTAEYVGKNEIAECTVELSQPIAFDLFFNWRTASRFVIVDNYEISGGGTITKSLQESTKELSNCPSELNVTSNRKKRVIWLTGLSGAGKTTIAEGAKRYLDGLHILSYVLDGDELRDGLCSDLGFSAKDRNENIRRIAQVAKLFSDIGIVTIVSTISPFIESRLNAKNIIGERYVEVYVKANMDTCTKRDPKGLYKRVSVGSINNFTGVDSPYEEPESPDYIIDTEQWGEEECIENLVNIILDLQ